MPTHYLMVYENALPFGQQFISTRRQIIFKTYFTCQFGMTFFYKICMDISCSKNLLIFFSIFRCEKLIN